MMAAFLLGTLVAIASAKQDVRQWNMMPPDVPPDTLNSSDSGNLGICFGSSTSWSQYPYSAALRYPSGSACCSASIVSLNPAILISAAHCSGCTGSVRIGCDSPSNCNGDSYTISQFVQHPSYGQGTSFSNDIAVVRLSQPITTSGAVPVSISNAEPTQGTARVVGYGVTQSGSIPSQLQTTQMSIIERNQCDQIMRSALGGFGSYIDQSMVCIRGGSAGADFVPATCSGDSGGPSHVGNNQYGVTSWGLQGSGAGCNSCSCCTGYPSVLANVAYFQGWINGYVSEETMKMNATLKL